MPKFWITEMVQEERLVEADTAQDALDLWLSAGDAAVVDGPFTSVESRSVATEAGEDCEVEDS